MFEDYFTEFYVTEQELKEQIYSTLRSLNTLEPEKFPSEVLEYADPSNSTLEILARLGDFFGELSPIISTLRESNVVDALRLISIVLTISLDGKQLSYLFTKQLFMTRSTLFLGIRYLLVSEVQSERLKKELKYDQDRVFSILLSNDASDHTRATDLIAAIHAAHEEIDRVTEDGFPLHYLEAIADFEEASEKYVRDHCGSVLSEALGRLAFEALLSNLSVIDDRLQLRRDHLSMADIKELVEELLKKVKQNTNRRIGRKHGGKRERKGYWTNERKISFYETVEALPTIGNRSCWQFALDELIEQDFDVNTVVWLRSHLAFKALSKDLLGDAVKVWRKYLTEENWTQMNREDKPRAFEFRHALLLLDCPQQYTFSTLETYYYAGRKLASDVQLET